MKRSSLIVVKHILFPYCVVLSIAYCRILFTFVLSITSPSQSLKTEFLLLPRLKLTPHAFTRNASVACEAHTEPHIIFLSI